MATQTKEKDPVRLKEACSSTTAEMMLMAFVDGVKLASNNMISIRDAAIMFNGFYGLDEDAEESLISSYHYHKAKRHIIIKGC